MIRRRFSKKRSYARRRPSYRKKFVRKARSSSGGVLRLVRKCPEQNVYNTAVTGTPAVTAGGIVTIGAGYQAPPFSGVGTYYNIPFAIQVKLNDLLSFAELTALADKYKIKWVKVRILSTSNTATSASTAQLPSIIYDIDHDDATLPLSTTAGLNAMRERMSSKLKQFKQNVPLTMFFRPGVITAGQTVAGAGVATNAYVGKSRFIDCGVVDVPHFGVKGYLQDVNLASTASTLTQFKFDISMGVTLKDIQ